MQFLELMLSFSLMPRIMNPTRITPRSQTLIDNICYNEVQHKIIAGKEDFNKTDWATSFSGNNIDVAFDTFLEKVKNLIGKHLPVEKVSKRKLKQQKRKPRISNDLLKQINY